MGLLEKITGLRAPYPGVRWDPSSRRVLAATETFRALPPEAQEAALYLPAWDFLKVGDNVYAKHIVEKAEGEETFFLLPALGYNEAIEKVQQLQKENNFLRDQLHAFVQQLPVPLFVIEEKADLRITYANPLLLELIGAPLSKLYRGLTLEDIFPDHVEEAKGLLEIARSEHKPQQVIIEGFRTTGHPYAYLVRAFPFETPSLRGVFFALVDVTREREQERRLELQNQELMTLTEELRQNQEELQVALKEVEAAQKEADLRRKELEDSLIAAQRYQRTMLLRTREITSLWGRDKVAIVARAHSYVGGDFLFAIKRGEYVYVVLGDATGHGPSGALLALTVRAQLLQAIAEISHPDELPAALTEAREALFEILDVKPDQTLSNDGAEIGLLALPIARSEVLYYAGAGRNLYLLDGDGTLHKYRGLRHGLGWNVPGSPLEPFKVEEIPYTSGGVLFLFSDGLSDQHNPDNHKLGVREVEQWLAQSASAGPEPADKVRYIMKLWHDFRQEAPQTDDVLLIALGL